jgi:hypothetical protein
MKKARIAKGLGIHPRLNEMGMCNRLLNPAIMKLA